MAEPNAERLMQDIGNGYYRLVDEAQLWACLDEIGRGSPSAERVPGMVRMRSAGATYRAIGEHYGISAERVRQQIVMAARKLRHPSRTVRYAERREGGDDG